MILYAFGDIPRSNQPSHWQELREVESPPACLSFKQLLSHMLLDQCILKILVPTSQQLLTLHICNALFGGCKSVW